MLIDTTVWIDFFNDKPSKQVKLLESMLANRDGLFICGIILTEILQGLSDSKQYQTTKAALEALSYLEMTQNTFLLSADIYRILRKKGITIRKSLDCMIGAVAIENNIPLLHNDRDFLPMAKYCGLLSF